jgi:translation elongation factor EF-4
VVVVVVVVLQILAAQAVEAAVKQTTPPQQEHPVKALLVAQAEAALQGVVVAVLVLSAAMVRGRAVQVVQERHLQSQVHP